MNKPDLIFSCGRLCLQENPTVDIAKELFQGRYCLEEEIGRGNNAVTFKGKDKFLDIDRAIRIGVCSKEEERLQKKFLEESKKNARKQSALIPVLFYSDFNFDKWVIQAAVIDYSDDELLSKWLELRKKRLENKDSESIFQIESDSIAFRSFIKWLVCLLCMGMRMPETYLFLSNLNYLKGLNPVSM